LNEAVQFIIDNELTRKTSDVIGWLHLLEYSINYILNYNHDNSDIIHTINNKQFIWNKQNFKTRNLNYLILKLDMLKVSCDKNVCILLFFFHL
jgi:hypothetical protein